MRHMKIIKSKKGLALLATVVVAGITAVGAVAYWTSSGSGSGTASTLNPTTAQLVVENLSAASGLYPGGSQPFTGDIQNNASYSVHVTSLAVDTVTAGEDNGVKVVGS